MIVNSGYWLTCSVTQTTATVFLAKNDQNVGNTAKLLPRKSRETETKISCAICQTTFEINKMLIFKGSERNYVVNTFSYNMLQFRHQSVGWSWR